MIKKIVASIVLAIFLLTSVFAPTALAQESSAPIVSGSWYNQPFNEWYRKVYDNDNPTEIFGERYTAAQVQWIIYGLFSFVINATGDPETTNCLMNSDLNDCIDKVNDTFSYDSSLTTRYANNKGGGFLAFMWKDKPLSAISYFKSLGRKFNLVPEAKAQNPGFGFTALEPILPLWRAARNISYALFAFVVVILSFMIMFRVKLSPQVVVTVQSALPKLVLAIILVTFSYAIAGLMVDLMYVIIGFFSLGLSQAISSIPVGIGNITISATDMFNLMTQGPFGLGIIGHLIIYFLLFMFSTFVVFLGVNGLVGEVVGLFTGVTWIMLFLAIIIVIIFAIMLLFITIKVGWMLFKALANIFLMVFIAPFQMALGAVVPGLGLGSWLRSFSSHLAVFPVTAVMIILAYLFLQMALLVIWEGLLPDSIGQLFLDIGFAFPLGNIAAGAISQQGWPPLLVFTVKNPMAIIFLGVSAVILMITPKVADMIQAIIKGQPFAAGTAIGAAFGPARAAATFAGISTIDSLAAGKVPFSRRTFSVARGTRGRRVADLAAVLRDTLKKR